MHINQSTECEICMKDIHQEDLINEVVRRLQNKEMNITELNEAMSSINSNDVKPIKNVTVDGLASFDMNDLDTDDLIEELSSRYLTRYEMKGLVDGCDLQDLIDNEEKDFSFDGGTVDDQLKFRHFFKILDDYSSWEIEKALPYPRKY